MFLAEGGGLTISGRSVSLEGEAGDWTQQAGKERAGGVEDCVNHDQQLGLCP